jgi:hypothetical protein
VTAYGILVMKFAACFRRSFAIRFRALFKELHETINQPAPAANYVQPAFVLMFFENLVQILFEF